MVHDLVHNLCESLVENIDGVAGIGKKTPPTPITYLTQWKIVGNSEVHGNEIWSCGEYSEIDNKYHIVVLPQGKSPVDIALNEPLRKVNDVTDTIEFPSNTEGKALVTRNLGSILIGKISNIQSIGTNTTDIKRMGLYSIDVKPVASNNIIANILCSAFDVKTANGTYLLRKGIAVSSSGKIQIYDPNYNTDSDIDDFKTAYADTEIIYELVIPTTELVNAPQIEEAESYTCVISQGGKAVSWSGFTWADIQEH